MVRLFNRRLSVQVNAFSDLENVAPSNIISSVLKLLSNRRISLQTIFSKPKRHQYSSNQANTLQANIWLRQVTLKEGSSLRRRVGSSSAIFGKCQKGLMPELMYKHIDAVAQGIPRGK